MPQANSREQRRQAKELKGKGREKGERQGREEGEEQLVQGGLSSVARSSGEQSLPGQLGRNQGL